VACASIDTSRKNARELFSNMHIIFKWYNEEVPKESRPIEFQDKALLTFYLCQCRKTEKKFDFQDILNRLHNGKFGNLVPLLSAIQEEVDDERYEQISNTIRQKRKMCELTKGKCGFQKLLEDIDSGSFIDDEEIIVKWEEQITKSHSNFMTLKKQESIGKAESYDMREGNVSAILDKLRESTNEEKSLKTGFDFLTKVLPAKGFENRRLYLIGGSSGVGKSAMLINLISNAVSRNHPDSEDSRPATYLYITAENLIDESWLRYYCCLKDKPHSKLVKEIEESRLYALKEFKAGNDEAASESLKRFDSKIQTEMTSILESKNSNILFKYVQSKRTTVRDIEAIIDSVYQTCNLRAIFIDYLDLITTGLNLEYRHELGVVTQFFKNFAVSYDCPVVTATQLNRDGYRPESEACLTQMGESMQKVDASDFILFLQKAKKPIGTFIVDGNKKKIIKKIRGTVLKNRNGKEGESSILMYPMTVGGEDVFSFKIQEMPANVEELDDDNIDQGNDINELDGGILVI
jgi:replicative DNA helicase